MTLLRVNGLCVEFGDGDSAVRVVDGVDLEVDPGEVLALVGESGSGKSVSMLALMGLIDAPGRVQAARLEFDGVDLLTANPAQRRRLLGRDIAMIFQDAQSSLNPTIAVGQQVCGPLRAHLGLSGAALKRRAIDLLEQVEIPDAARRFDAYPHELSGGMNQRVMIAMAIACKPRLLIADEPTTALDVTVQAQVMKLLRRLQVEHSMALLLITHDLAVVAETASRIAVMYAGQIVETARVPAIFDNPLHPYTAALLAALPERNRGAERLSALPGRVPAPHECGVGCRFAPRCARADSACLGAPIWQRFSSSTTLPEVAAARCFHPIRPLESTS